MMAPLLLFVVQVQPLLADPSSLDELVESGIVQLTFTGNGGHTENCVTLHATNLGSEFLTTRLEPGRTLIASDKGEQNIVITQELILAMHPDQTIERQVFGFCFQSLDAGPGFGSSFTLGPTHQGSLQKVAAFLNRHRDIPGYTQQEAIWVVSDCHPLSSIHAYDDATEALALFVADALGLEKPWYTTDHVKTVDELFTRQVQRIYGEIPFQVAAYSTLEITILDQNGRVMKRLVRSTNYGPGNYTQPIDLQVRNWPQGEYAIRFEEAKEGVVKEEVFEL
ncbi:MAG: hypothetical protein HQ500_02085 [Flavobacteriales bacterium]|nr:hypothetical protein [Flavobacteriales bacterium]